MRTVRLLFCIAYAVLLTVLLLVPKPVEWLDYTENMLGVVAGTGIYWLARRLIQSQAICRRVACGCILGLVLCGAESFAVDLVKDGQPAVYIGEAAIRAGLKLDDIDSPSREGARIRSAGSRILIAGQTTPATHRAVDITAAVKPRRNVAAVRVDHTLTPPSHQGANAPRSPIWLRLGRVRSKL